MRGFVARGNPASDPAARGRQDGRIREMSTHSDLATPLPPGRCLLFAYGQLQPGQRPPRTLSWAWPDRVLGELLDLGDYPAAVKVGLGESCFRGYVLELAESELTTELDAFEGVPELLYRRIRTITKAGYEVWIYEYARPLPHTAWGPIESWP